MPLGEKGPHELGAKEGHSP